MTKNRKAVARVPDLPMGDGDIPVARETAFKILANEHSAIVDQNGADFIKAVPAIVVPYYLRQTIKLVDWVAVFRQGWSAGVLDVKTANDNDVAPMITRPGLGAHKDASNI